MKYIYLYTTKTYHTKNWYKIGQTVVEPATRIQQQDNASNPEPLILVQFWEVNSNLTDKTIHSRLEDCGFFRIRFNREWFELSDKPMDDIESCFITEDRILTPHLFEEKPNIIMDIPHYTDLWWYKSI